MCWAARSAPAARSASKGLPEAGKGPAFAAAVGLLVYPQVAHVEHFEPRAAGARYFATGTDGYFSRVGRWLKDSF